MNEAIKDLGQEKVYARRVVQLWSLMLTRRACESGAQGRIQGQESSRMHLSPTHGHEDKTVRVRADDLQRHARCKDEPESARS